MEYFRDRFVEELNVEGEIEIRGLVWQRDQVVQGLDPAGYNQIFEDWIDTAKSEAKQRAREFLEANRCLERFRRLTARVRAQSVVPWVGAGMSIPSAFPGWGQFLRNLAEEDPGIVGEVNRLLEAGQFEEAAQLIVDRLSQNILNENIENVFGIAPQNPCGPVRLLPDIFRVGVVTTNFDYTLDRVYELADRRFARAFAGRDLRVAPQQAAEDRHCLFRVHGEANNADGRVLTRADYDRVYANEGTLEDVLNGLVANRSLLFLGASLSIDRSLMALTDLRRRAQVQNPRHYAFLPLPSEDHRVARRRELEAADIHPIWYPNDGEHDQHIEDLLICLLEGGIDG